MSKRITIEIEDDLQRVVKFRCMMQGRIQKVIVHDALLEAFAKELEIVKRMGKEAENDKSN